MQKLRKSNRSTDQSDTITLIITEKFLCVKYYIMQRGFFQERFERSFLLGKKKNKQRCQKNLAEKQRELDYREETIKMLMDGIDESRLEMAYGVVWGAHRDAQERKKAGNYVRPKLSRRMEAIRLLMEIEGGVFLNRIYKTLQYHAGENRICSDGEWYREHTTAMLYRLDSEKDEKFLRQIWTIVGLHIEKKGGAV